MFALKKNGLNLLVKGLIAVGTAAGLFLSYLLLSEMGAAVDRLSVELYGNHALTAFTLTLGILFVIGAVAIAVTLFLMMCSLENDPFVMKNVKALRFMGFVALGMAACCILFAFVPAQAILVIFAGCGVGLCGLFSLVLSRVFARAVAFKQENDLTV